MILPHIQQRVDESEFHGARELLELLKRELTIRSPLEDGEDGEGHPDVQRTPRNIRYVLERMSLGSLIVLVCAKEMRGHLVMVASWLDGCEVQKNGMWLESDQMEFLMCHSTQENRQVVQTCTRPVWASWG